MDLLTLLLLAVGLSMDAFAVSICKGLAMKKVQFNKSIIVGLWFGGFQGMMPFIGYVLGIQFEAYINDIAPWIAFVLLGMIGINMVREALTEKEDEGNESSSLKFTEMLVLAIATSIDAMAVGITFACVPVKIMANATGLVNTAIACLIIAATTGVISMGGVYVGSLCGTRYKKKAEVVGGLILVLLGVRIIVEHFV